jgi:8-amino-3,8-dideoxy-alpha-D-manno-octulosonate transaminase
MSDEEWRYAELSDACFVEPTSLIAKTRIIAIEISNICNYGTIHPRCPVHNYKTKEVLPADSIKRILDELGEIGFTGCIGWGCYTEPLIDPRLVDLVSYARKVCPVAKNSLTTNGFYLTEDSAADLVSAGIDQIFVSAYSMSEYLRLILLPIPASYTVYNSKLEKRTEDNVYSRKPLDSNARCLPFILNLMITCRGDLGLCCFDFERRHTFGNIHTATLRELLSNQAVIEVHRRLAAGDRSVLDACRRCGNGFSSYPYWLAA